MSELSCNNFIVEDSIEQTIETTNINEIVKKFKIYRMAAELNEKKIKESEIVINQLKDSIRLSNESEKNLRNQLHSSQTRLLKMQNNLKILFAVKEKQLENEKISENIDKHLSKLTGNINQIEEKIKNLLQKTSNELNLIKEMGQLKSDLRSKERAFESLKADLQKLSEKKEESDLQLGLKIESLKNELENLKRKSAERESESKATVLLYKKKIEDNENIIKEFERERQILMEEFEFPEKLKYSRCNNFSCTWESGAISVNQSARCDSNKVLKQCTTNKEDLKESEDFVNLTASQETSKKEEPKTNKKQKREQDFVVHNKEQTEGKYSFSKISIKRKLFSTNCNHYLK